MNTSKKIVKYEQLASTLSKSPASLNEGRDLSLTIATADPCYIKQNLTVIAGDPEESEIILIEAPAAVGKSTLARQLSATCNIPLLDLSRVGVYTHSLRGIIGADVSSFEGDALQRFTEGRLPLIVDALDESLLLSGTKAFEDFLETTWALLSINRIAPGKPKLVMIGRPDACVLVEASLAANSQISMSKLQLDFFTRSEAFALVAMQTHFHSKHMSLSTSIPAAAEMVVESYFRAIAVALTVSEEELWDSDEGRSFAGYAPVLSALGKLLAETKNYAKLNESFRNSDNHSAWASMENVAKSVMVRERAEKIGPPLEKALGRPAPESAYNVDEQYALLAEYLSSNKFVDTGLVELHGDDFQEYRKLAEIWIQAHPFLADGEPANSVLGSMIYGRSIAAGKMTGHEDFRRLGEASDFPFLWRSFLTAIESDPAPVIDGRHLGYLLTSLLSDPIDHPRSITIHGGDDNSFARAEILTTSTGWHILDISPPIRFYGKVENCEVLTGGSIEFWGYERGHNRSSIYLKDASITSEQMDFNAGSATLDGTVWLDTAELRSPTQIDVKAREKSSIGWDRAFSDRYPWNRNKTTLPRKPGSRPENDPIYALLEDMRIHLSGPGAIILNKSDFDLADSSSHSYAKKFHQIFGKKVIRKFMAALLDNNMAVERGIDSRGAAKIVLGLNNTTWEKIQKAYLSGEADDERVSAFLSDVQQIFRLARGR